MTGDMFADTYRFMQLNIKIWLGDEKEHGFLGEGRYRLFREIERTGSLAQAAEKLSLSYRKAWGDVRAVESRLGFQLVNRRRGGSLGGASTLNERGKKLLEAYGRIQSNLHKQAQRQFKQKLEPLLSQKKQKNP